MKLGMTPGFSLLKNSALSGLCYIGKLCTPNRF
jgi:hypothetical protein